MCDCIEVVDKKLLEAGSNTALDIPMILTHNPNTINTNTIKANRVSIKTKKIDSKKRKKAQTVFSSYCPFCGNQYT